MSTWPADALETQLHERIFRPLALLRLRCRVYLALQGLRRLLFVVVGLALAQLLLDRCFRLSVDQRAVPAAAITLVGLWVLYRHVAAPLLRPLPNAYLAALVDRAHPRLCDQLATAVQLAGDVQMAIGVADDAARLPRGASPDLIREVLRQACLAARGTGFLEVLDHRRAVRRSAASVGLLLLVVAAFAQLPGTMGTWFARNWLLQDVAWPQRTYIWPDGFGPDGRRRLARGDVAEITATVRGEVPATAVLEWVTASGRTGHEAMSVVGDTQLVASIGQLSEDVRFRISGGDERTREFVVEAAERPRVTRVVARITPPAYTRLEPVVIEQQTVLELLHGSTLELVAELSKSVRAARFLAADGTDVPCEWTRGGPDAASPSARVAWAEPASGTYRFDLVDDDGLTSQNAVRYTLKVVPDRPPTVQLQLSGAGELITPQAELPVELVSEDAYGLGAVRLHVQMGSQAERTIVPEGFAAGERKLSKRLVLSVAAQRAAPGDRLRVWAEAADLAPGAPNVATTPVMTLRVVARDEFVTEMARRELLLRQEFERLRTVQRGLQESLRQMVAGLATEGPRPGPISQRLAGLSRQQAEQGARCDTIARAFEQILLEMQVSRVAGATDERRITERVVLPLNHLAHDTIPAAGAALGALARTASAEQQQACAEHQATTLREMDEILANMLEWEGYREAIAALQEVIQDEKDIRQETLQTLERQLDDMLGPEASDEKTDAPGPER